MTTCHPQLTKNDILQVGLDIILIKGFNGTGVEAILKQPNAPKGSFYNFFSSKEEFGLAIIDKYVTDIGERIHAIFKIGILKCSPRA